MSLEHSPAREGAHYAFTISEFCETHRVSRSWLYSEWKAGRGPKVKKIGAKNIITAEAAAEWRNADAVDATDGARGVEAAA
jgi:predicted DNA-binding transcriptional regulator AlpA